MQPIAIDELESRLARAAQRFVPRSQAAYCARLWIGSHLKKAPRMNPVKEALADLQVWEENPDRRVRTLTDAPGAFLLDFDGLAPSLMLGDVHDRLADKARASGIAAAGFRNSAGVVTLGPWVDGLAERDLVGVAMFNGGTGCCVPHGGTRGVLGTNPLAWAVPTLDAPMTVDMATTEIPFFAVKGARDAGTPLPDGAAVDEKGRVTTDAARALDDAGVANLLPLGGGFKGYGLMMLIELLTGPLVRSLLSTAQRPGWNPTEYGALVIAFDIAAFIDPAAFKRQVSSMSDLLRSERPAPGASSVAVPGDRGHVRAVAARAGGKVEIDDRDAATLDRLSGPG